MKMRRAAGAMVLVVSIALLCAAGLWLWRSLPGRLALAEARIRDEAARMGLRVSYREARLRLLTPNVSFESATVEDAASGVPILRAERVDASLSFRSILFGGSPVSRVRLHGYTLTLADGDRPLIERLRVGAGGRDQEMPEILLFDGTVRLGPLGPIARWEARVPEIRIRKSAYLGTRVTFLMEKASGEIRWAGRTAGAWPFSTASGDFSVREGRVRIRRLAARSDYASVKISGTVEPGRHDGDLQVSGEGSVAGWIAGGGPGAKSLADWMSRGQVIFSASVRGKLTDPTGTAKVVLRDGRLSGNTPADAELVLAASRRKVRLESLKGKLWGGILSGSAEYDLAAAAGEAKLSLRQAALGAAPWAAFGVPARPVGTGDAEVRMSGGPARLRGTILLSIPEGFGIPPGADGRPVRARLPLSVAASGEIVPGREIVLSNFRVRLGGARVEGNGSASLPGREIAFRGTATAPAGKVSDYGWEYPLAWQGLSGQWEIAGPADRPRLSARIEGEGLAARALPPLSAVVRIEGNAADAVHFAADIPSSLGRATATGTVTGPFNHGPFHLEATAVVREIDFSQGARWGRAVLSSLGRDPSGVPRIMDEVTGSGTADLRIVVGTGSIILGGSVRIPEVRVRGMPLRAVRAEGNWESGPGREEWHAEASGEAAGGTLEVTGKGRESGMEIAGSLERLDVGQAAALLGAKAGGSVRGAATVSFVARRRGEVWELPRVAVTSAGISAGGMTWQGVSAEGFLGPASGKMSLRTASPAVRAEADIRREPGWPVTATLSARGVPNAVFLAAAGRRGEAAGGSWNLAAEGSARAADLARPGADPADAIGSFRFSAVADNLSVSGMTFRSLVASGRKEESRIRGEIRTSAPESDLAFSLALREPFAFRLEGPFAMATAAGESGSENGTPRFAVSGRVDVGGALRAIDQASGTLHVARLRFRQYGVEITGRDLDAALDAGGVRWVGGTVEAAGNPLRVSGKVSWKGDMDVRVAGKVPAAAIRMATDVFDRLDGTIRAEARFTGPLGNPTVVGTGHLEAGAFSFKGYAQLFEEMTADAVISKEKILFEHFEGRSGGGYVEGWGEVPLAFGAGQRFYFSVDFFDVRYPYPDDFRPVIQGHMELIGPIDDLLVTGDLEVQSARYTRTIRPEKSLVDFRRRVAAVTARREQGEFRIRLDIDAVADGTIRIKNNLVDAQAKGEFKIVGDSSRVIVLGAFDVVEGTIEYRGNKYEIKRLTVDFQDPRRNNPRIDGRAETRKGNVVITVSVTGTLDQYEVEFASDPPLSKNSIVSLLSLGVPAEALAGAEGTVGAGAAASVALGPYKGRVEEEIRGIVGLDKFAVEPVFSPTSKSFESRFTIGKDFGDRFSVSFSTNVGGATPDSAATAEFKVGENVFLEGAWQSSGIQPEGAVGGDVKFRYRYKQFKDFLGRGAE